MRQYLSFEGGFLICLLLSLLLMTLSCGKDSGEAVPNESYEKSNSTVLSTGEMPSTGSEHSIEHEIDLSKTVQFPYTVNTALEIRSISSSSIPNPDAGGVYGEKIATLLVLNKSNKIILNAEITVAVKDGETYHFYVEYLPAGKEMQVFDTNNLVYDGKTECAVVVCENPAFGETDPLKSDRVSFTLEGDLLTLVNLTDDDIADLQVVTLCKIGDCFFGGQAYFYEIGKLPAGKSQTVHLDSSLFGLESVVSLNIS